MKKKLVLIFSVFVTISGFSQTIFGNWNSYDEETNKIESVIGQGVEVMQSYVDRQFSFDLIFIDADKNNYPHYYELSLELLPSNGIIIIDNMLWGGDVADLSIKDTQTETIRSLNEKIQKDETCCGSCFCRPLRNRGDQFWRHITFPSATSTHPAWRCRSWAR